MTRESEQAAPTAIVAGEVFVGREWALDRVDEWLAGDDQRSLLITGDPGTGKTALALRIAAVSDGRAPADGRSRLCPGAIAYAHFCRALDPAALDPLQFVESLARSLATQCEPYARALLDLGEQQIEIRGRAEVERAEPGAQVAGIHIANLRIGNMSAALAFERLVRRPLAQLDPPAGRPFVVLVDALDEALTLPGEETLVTVLVDALAGGAPPSSLHFLLTSRRPDSRVLHRLAMLRLDLLDNAPADVDDVQRYAETRLAALPAERRRTLASRVARAGAGNFLYARYVVTDLLADPARLDDVSQLPAGLEEHYKQYVERELARTEKDWEERYRPVLGLLAIARGDGLTRELLSGATDLARSRVDDALHRLGQYLEGPLPDGPFRIYHQSFRDFLTSDRDYGVYPDEAERALTGHLIAATPTSPDGQRDWSRASDYARAHLATHAAAGGVLDPLVEDPGFLVAADPERLLLALPSLTAPAACLARPVYRHAFDALRRRPPAERASYLEMSARQAGADHLAEQLARQEPTRPWSAQWAHWRPAGEHFIAGRHDGGVWAVAVGELDGRPAAVSGGDDGTLRVWDLASGAQHGEPLTGHDGWVWAVAVGELDGRPVAVSGGDDATLRVWDLASGAQHGEPLTGHDGGVSAVAVGELDGRPVAVSGGDDGTLRVWDLASGAQHGEPLTGHDGGVRAVAVGELDGRPVAVSGGDDGTLRVWGLGGSELAAIEVGSAIRAVRMRSPTILVGADAGVIALELMLAKPPA